MKTEEQPLPHFFSFIKRISAFLSAVMIFLFLLYVYGCFQMFMDETQLFLLRLLAVVSVFLSIVSSLFFVFSAIVFIYLGKKTMVHTRVQYGVYFAVILVISAVLAVVSLSIITVSNGL